MSFDIDSFSPIGGQARAGNSPAHWSYESSVDDLAAVQAPDYFNEIATQVVSGDFINASLTDGKTIITIASTTIFPKQVVIDPEVIGSGVGGDFSVEEFTDTTKILAIADNLTFIVMDNAAAQTVIIPDDSSEAFPIGAEIEFLRAGVGSVNFVVAGAVVLQSRDALTGINTQYSAATLKKIAANEWSLVGDLAAGVFSALNLSNLETWHDAADATTILEVDNVGFVSTLQDKSGNGNDLVQTTPADQPTTGTEIINSLNAIGFDGVNDVLRKTSLTLSSSITLFMVVNVPSTADAGEAIVAFGNAGAFNFEITSGIINQFRARFENSMGEAIPPQSPVDLLGQDVLLVYRLSAGDGLVNLRIDGVDIATDTYNGTFGGTLDYKLAQSRSGGTFIDMKFAEAMIYDRDLNLNEISALENSLKPKWGIA